MTLPAIFNYMMDLLISRFATDQAFPLLQLP
jgi:hypothetical protein